MDIFTGLLNINMTGTDRRVDADIKKDHHCYFKLGHFHQAQKVKLCINFVKSYHILKPH